MKAIDTNVLVRLLARDDADQAERAERFVANGAWVSHLVLAETVWVLESVFDLDRDRIAAGVSMLLDHRQLEVQDPDVAQAALAAFRSAPKVGFSDCLILESARKAGNLPLGTFERALSGLDGAKGI